MKTDTAQAKPFPFVLKKILNHDHLTTHIICNKYVQYLDGEQERLF